MDFKVGQKAYIRFYSQYNHSKKQDTEQECTIRKVGRKYIEASYNATIVKFHKDSLIEVVNYGSTDNFTQLCKKF